MFWVDLLPLVLGSDLLLRSRPPSGSGVLPEPGPSGSRFVDIARPTTEARLGQAFPLVLGSDLLLRSRPPLGSGVLGQVLGNARPTLEARLGQAYYWGLACCFG